MADRILIGQRGDEMGVWISLPGRNVGDQSDRMIFSSQHDYLKFHAQGTYKIPNVSGTSNLYQGAVSFPRLDYYPMHFCSFCTSENGQRVFFPNDNSIDTERMPNCQYVITNDTIYFFARGPNFKQDVSVRWMVFKNKLADL